MPTYGYGRGSVNNEIGLASAYPGGRTMGLTAAAANRYQTRNNSAGELASAQPSNIRLMASQSGAETDAPVTANGLLGKPSSWWIIFALVFVGFVWFARRYGGSESERFGNVKMSVYNGVFLTFYIVLILNLMKVFAAKIRIPGVSDLILAA